MSEKDIESYLVRKVKLLGGEAYKFSSPSRRGVPDRVVVLPSGTVLWVELKAGGKQPTLLQSKEHARLQALGQRVVVVDSKEGVDALLQ